MKNFLSIVILISLVLLQIHGSTHSDSGHHSEEHNCAVCEIVSHQPNLVPTTLDINLNLYLPVERIFLITRNSLVTISFFSISIIPRAPPIV